MMRVLLIEDNRRISEFVLQGLEESGYAVTLAENGPDARELLGRKNWDVVLLDIMLPGIDGYELLQFIRYKKNNVPVLVVSALSEPDDKVKALEMGADDYLAKPFHFKELVARINALCRRNTLYAHSSKATLECGPLKLDDESHRVILNGKDVKLTLQEFKLLKLLMENADRVLSRSEILETVWGMNYDSGTNVVDVYISYLRNKLEKNGDKFIETIKGRGYMLRPKV